jgi:hypothetical protein
VNWAVEEKSYSQRRACKLVGIAPRVYRYRSSRPDDAGLRQRLKELSSERRRFGYRRLHLLLKREGVSVNWKRLYRIYKEERLTVRKRGGRKRAWAQGHRWRFRRIRTRDGPSTLSPTPLSTADVSASCASSTTSAGMPGDHRRQLDLGGTRGPRTRCHRRASWLPVDGGQRQWIGADIKRHPCLAAGSRCRMALHRARQTDAKRLRRKLQRKASGRMPQRAPVPQLPPCPRHHRGMAHRLQSEPAPHEPRRAHTERVCNQVPNGPQHEQG